MLTSRLWTASRLTTGRCVRGIMTSAENSQKTTIKFGSFDVTKQVFLKSQHSFGVVNLKPLVPGHVLICPISPHRRLTDLTPPEITDLFSAVQSTQALLARAHFPAPHTPTAGSFTIAVQDGAAAGQTVPHVHVHVIPRLDKDLGENPDEVYVRMAGEEGNVGGALWDRERPRAGGAMPKIEDGDRRARSDDKMVEEADKYKALLKEMGIGL